MRLCRKIFEQNNIKTEPIFRETISYNATIERGKVAFREGRRKGVSGGRICERDRI